MNLLSTLLVFEIIIGIFSSLSPAQFFLQDDSSSVISAPYGILAEEGSSPFVLSLSNTPGNPKGSFSKRRHKAPSKKNNGLSKNQNTQQKDAIKKRQQRRQAFVQQYQFFGTVTD